MVTPELSPHHRPIGTRNPRAFGQLRLAPGESAESRWVTRLVVRSG